MHDATASTLVRRWHGLFTVSRDYWALTAVLAAALLALPIVSVTWIALSSTDSIWPHLVSTVLPRALTNTLLLLVGASILALAIGTGTAWLITMFRFPGREWGRPKPTE